MKQYYKNGLILFLVIAAIASCKKDNSSSNQPTIKLSVADSGRTVTMAKGQVVAVTLGNPGDGGLIFDTWQYDASVLHLDSHVHTPPANNMLVGDFGTDTWQFTSLQSGTSTLKITATRNYTITMFNGKVIVK